MSEPREFSAKCGAAKIKIRKAGARWEMWAGGVRRIDFASPTPEHARNTAERWYGPVADGWAAK